MIVDDDFRKTVAILYVDTPDDVTGVITRTPAATAFRISIPAGGREVPYLVTARHVLYRARPYKTMYLRLNKHSGGYDDLPIPVDGWAENYDSDVVAIRTINYAEYDSYLLKFDSLATDSYVEKNGAALGDDVFFVGLFSEDPGIERSEPVLRFGKIARMPRPLMLRIDPAALKERVMAYLVEARSWGGQSGSPAFIYYEPTRQPGKIQFYQDPVILGLVSGHYWVETERVSFVGDLEMEDGDLYGPQLRHCVCRACPGDPRPFMSSQLPDSSQSQFCSDCSRDPVESVKSVRTMPRCSSSACYS